jgi:hypothetical protein
MTPPGLISQNMLYAYAALGAFTHWMMIRYGRNLQRGAEQLFDDLAANKLRLVGQISLFVILGALISVVMVDPTTNKQALAAGMAWTTLLSGIATAGMRRVGKRNGN